MKNDAMNKLFSEQFQLQHQLSSFVSGWAQPVKNEKQSNPVVFQSKLQHFKNDKKCISHFVSFPTIPLETLALAARHNQAHGRGPKYNQTANMSKCLIPEKDQNASTRVQCTYFFPLTSKSMGNNNSIFPWIFSHVWVLIAFVGEAFWYFFIEQNLTFYFSTL